MAGYTLAPSFSTTNETRNPWAPAQPALNTALSGALNAYNTTYNGPLVAEMDPNVTAGQNAQLGIAGKGMTSGAAQAGIGGVQGLLANNGIGAPMQQGLDQLQQAASYLNPYASGANVGNNPYLDDLISRVQNNAQQAVNANFSKSGRYGSGAYAGALGKELGNIDAQYRYQDYMNQMQNQLGAINSLAGIGSQTAGIGQQAAGNMLNGGNALSSYINPLYSDANQQKAVGGERMDYRQSQIDTANQAPWTKAGNLAQISQGIGGMGGTSNSTTFGISPMQQQQQPSTGQMIAGGLLGGLGVAGNLGAGGLFKNLFGGGPTTVYGGLGSRGVPTF